MKILITFIFLLVAISAQAANPSFGSFNTNHFGTSGNLVSVKSGASLTNILANGISNNGVLYSPTNVAPLAVVTNELALNTYYTNGNQRARVSLCVSNTAAIGGAGLVGLYIDQDGDGTFEDTGTVIGVPAGVALLSVSQITGYLSPNARFVFTNLSSGVGGLTTVKAGSSRIFRE